MHLHTFTTRFFLFGSVSLTLCWGTAGTVAASVLAADEASNSAYSLEDGGAWKGLDPTLQENPPGSDNGGFGFDPWDFRGGFHSSSYSPYGRLNHFIDGVDFPASSFNDLREPAFGLTNANQAFFGYTARATRSFAPLEIGHTLSVDFDNPLLQPLDPTADAGFLIRLNTGAGPVIIGGEAHERFGVFATAGFSGDRWNTADAAGLTDTGVSDNDTASGATLLFTLTGDETYSVEFQRLGDGETLFARSGQLKNMGTGAIDSLEITMFGNGSGSGTATGSPTGEREFFINNLQITTAETTLAGDYNHDGIVNAADFSIWRDNLGGDAEVLNGNGSGSSTVSHADYDLWKTNFGRSSATLLAPSSSHVPEPATAFLLAIAAAGSRFFWAVGKGESRGSYRPRRAPDHRSTQSLRATE